MVNISARIRQVQPSSTLALTAKAKELRAQGYPVISLAAGEPDFPMPRVACTAIEEAMQQGFTRYTPTSGTLELKEAIARKLKRDQALTVQPNQIAVSCGAKHALYNLMQVLCGSGDEVLLPRPYWVSYPEMVKLAGAKSVMVDTGSDFLMTADRIEAVLTPNSKIVILNSPSNPTGAVLPASELKKIAQLIQSKGLFCITDEIYEYYMFDGGKHASVIEFLDEPWKHAALVNGVSKSFGMTGLRIGYTVADPAIIKLIGTLQDHSTSNPTSLSQKAAVAVMALGKDYQRDLLKTYEEKRDGMLKLIDQIPKLKAFKPRGAFYVFASVQDTGIAPQDFCNRLLEDQYVAVIPGEGFGSQTGVRLSFATSTENIKAGCKRIQAWIESGMQAKYVVQER